MARITRHDNKKEVKKKGAILLYKIFLFMSFLWTILTFPPQNETLPFIFSIHQIGLLHTPHGATVSATEGG